MAKSNAKGSLFSEFDKTSAQKWKEKIIKDLSATAFWQAGLKGVEYDKKLVWETGEGFDINPFYTNTDHTDNNINHTDNKSWFICEEISVDQSKDAINKAVHALQKGAGSVNFIIDDAGKFDVNALLKKIDVTSVPVTFTIKEQPTGFLEKFYAELNKLNIPAKKIKGSINYQRNTASRVTRDENFFEELARLHALTKNSPDFYYITINCIKGLNKNVELHTQQIAFFLSRAVEYLEALSERGINIDEAASKIQFNLPVGPNYFFEIAKLRAVRLLWADVLGAFLPVPKESGKIDTGVISPPAPSNSLKGEPPLVSSLKIHIDVLQPDD
ncbi:MAG: hypothetical protein IIA88_08050, partial [Bacteroidetes bacterium]|nr:hypothetical protein [Bacteroidota bacterium]